ncbi:MAG TPA: hypothetical protein PK006_11355 [Saprospiraceae bacterium]|nr:hypothetical protein [Saprospiraceae bacterium]
MEKIASFVSLNFLFRICFLSLFFGNVAVGQEWEDIKPNPKEVRKVRHTEVGINISPLITKLIPFGNGLQFNGPFAYRVKYYGRKYAFRFSMNMRVLDMSNDDVPTLSLGLGYERRREISSKWSFINGIELVSLGGDLGIPGGANSSFESATGIAPFAGVEFYILPNLALSTETYLVFGISSSTGLALITIPPVGIFMNFSF